MHALCNSHGKDPQGSRAELLGSEEVFDVDVPIWVTGHDSRSNCRFPLLRSPFWVPDGHHMLLNHMKTRATDDRLTRFATNSALGNDSPLSLPVHHCHYLSLSAALYLRRELTLARGQT